MNQGTSDIMDITGEGNFTLSPEDTDMRLSSVPWSKCSVEGCDARTVDGEVVQRDLASGENKDVHCNVCKLVVTPQQLANNKVNVKQEFSKDGIIILLCEFCVFEKRATCFCPDCPSLLCEDCTKLHPGFRLSQDHIRLTSDLTEQENEDRSKLSNCARHPDIRSSHCCVSCNNENLCRACKRIHDSSHELIDMRRK